MKKMSVRHMFFKTLACVAQLAALFPFAVIFEALGLGKLEVLHFAVIYAVWIVFRLAGWLIGRLFIDLQSRKLSKKLLPILNFISRMGVVVPIAAFIILGVWLNVHAAAYVYILPAAVISYYGGNLSVGKNYSDIFTKSWFVLYIVTAVVAMAMMAVSKETVPPQGAGYVLCVGFGVVILLSGVLANQTNIDLRTKQRDSGKAVLPAGLRRYNAVIVISVFALTLGLFLFAKPIAGLLKFVLSAVINAAIALFRSLSHLFRLTEDDAPYDSKPFEGFIQEELEGAETVNIVFALAAAAAAVLAIIFRKKIVAGIKNLFAPLFKGRKKYVETPFADEITSSDAKPSLRMQKKAERDLARRYARETSPERKYRLGYALFLARLRQTKQPPEPSDTTYAHREKGEAAFGGNLREFTDAYNRVRYGDITPTAEELSAESELLRRIK